MAPHSSTFAWKIPWTEEPGRLQSLGSLRLHFPFSLSCTGEGNGNSLQCSCLENPRDGKPGGLPSMGLHRVGHDWSNLAAAAAADNSNINNFKLLLHWRGSWIAQNLTFSGWRGFYVKCHFKWIRKKTSSLSIHIFNHESGSNSL